MEIDTSFLTFDFFLGLEVGFFIGVYSILLFKLILKRKLSTPSTDKKGVGDGQYGKDSN